MSFPSALTSLPSEVLSNVVYSIDGTDTIILWLTGSKLLQRKLVEARELSFFDVRCMPWPRRFLAQFDNLLALSTKLGHEHLPGFAETTLSPRLLKLDIFGEVGLPGSCLRVLAPLTSLTRLSIGVIRFEVLPALVIPPLLKYLRIQFLPPPPSSLCDPSGLFFFRALPDCLESLILDGGWFSIPKFPKRWPSQLHTLKIHFRPKFFFVSDTLPALPSTLLKLDLKLNMVVETSCKESQIWNWLPSSLTDLRFAVSPLTFEQWEPALLPPGLQHLHLDLFVSQRLIVSLPDIWKVCKELKTFEASFPCSDALSKDSLPLLPPSVEKLRIYLDEWPYFADKLPPSLRKVTFLPSSFLGFAVASFGNLTSLNFLQLANRIPISCLPATLTTLKVSQLQAEDNSLPAALTKLHIHWNGFPLNATSSILPRHLTELVILPVPRAKTEHGETPCRSFSESSEASSLPHGLARLRLHRVPWNPLFPGWIEEIVKDVTLVELIVTVKRTDIPADFGDVSYLPRLPRTLRMLRFPMPLFNPLSLVTLPPQMRFLTLSLHGTKLKLEPHHISLLPKRLISANLVLDRSDSAAVSFWSHIHLPKPTTLRYAVHDPTVEIAEQDPLFY